MNDILRNIAEKSLIYTPEMLTAFSKYLYMISKNQADKMDKTDSDMIANIAFSLQTLSVNVQISLDMIDEYTKSEKDIT